MRSIRPEGVGFRRRSAVVAAVLFAVILPIQGSGDEPTGADSGVGDTSIRIRLLHPARIVSGACFPTLTLEAVQADGTRASDFQKQVSVSGLLVRAEGAAPNSAFRSSETESGFSDGLLELSADSIGVKQLAVAESGLRIQITGEDRPTVLTASAPASGPSILRLLPPLLAIGLAILLRDVVISLILATFGGCLLFTGWTDPAGGVDMLCTVLVDMVADRDHASVILFTVMLGAMIGVMNDSGGTRAVVDRLATFAVTRTRGMMMTWLMGLVVFFDDYANTLLIGGAMRPLCDRLKISREKLAYLIDSTAAPVAGIAFSTWTAVELDYISAGMSAIGADTGAVSTVFWSTLPYRIYPIVALILVGTVAVSGRDLPAMRRAEQKMMGTGGRVSGSSAETTEDGSMWTALVPVAVLVGCTVTGFILGADSYRLLMVASLLASLTAFVVTVAAGKRSIHETSESLMKGVASMMPAVTVLILAWAVSDLCRPEKLDTAGYLIGLIGESVDASWLPALAFIVSGAVALSIGSSFTTMALMIPMIIPLCRSLIPDPAAAVLMTDPMMLGAVGAIMAGAIFGDHCSPISDTTVLSSAAAGCDHLRHVSTQLPYAFVGGASSLLIGYVPVGFGVPWWIAMPAAAVIGVLIVLLGGREPEPESGTSAEAAG